MEVRVIDLQECPKMDVAIAVFVRAALQMLSVRIRSCGLALPDRAALVADHRGALKLGLDSEVSVRLIEKPRAPRTVRDLLCGLLEAAEQYVSQREQPYLGLVEARLCDGSLAERIRRRAEAVRAGSRRRKAILDIYRELMDCLDSNTPWAG